MGQLCGLGSQPPAWPSLCPSPQGSPPELPAAPSPSFLSPPPRPESQRQCAGYVLGKVMGDGSKWREVRGPGQRLSPGTPDLPPPLPQLVAGIKYYLTVEMGSTACRKNAMAGDHIDLTTCPLAAGVQQEVTALPPARHQLTQWPAAGPSGCTARIGLASPVPASWMTQP